MSSSAVVDLFVEDRAHEEFMKALIVRIAREAGKWVAPRIRSARGGHGRALTHFSLFQRDLLASSPLVSMPAVIVVAIDANCQSYSAARKGILSRVDPSICDRTIAACPDPHIELWYLSDLDAINKVIGTRPVLGPRKCERDRYKAILSKTVTDGGFPPTLGGIEFAQEIVEAMDFYRAGRNVKSLKHFLDEVTARINAL